MMNVVQITGILRDTLQPWRVLCPVMHHGQGFVCLDSLIRPNLKKWFFLKYLMASIKPKLQFSLRANLRGTRVRAPLFRPGQQSRGWFFFASLGWKLLGQTLNYIALPLSALAAGMTQQVRERILIFRHKKSRRDPRAEWLLCLSEPGPSHSW